MLPIDYETLRIIWWLLLGSLLIGFAVTDGWDLGIAICLPWVGKTDMERRILINSIGPTWESNQVWLIVGAGVIFAAWPALYAIAFSGFYLAMLLTLLALILRPVAIKYRSKLSASLWRTAWDYALFISGLVPALIFGVALGNVLQGVPFYFNLLLRPFYTGTFLNLLNPYALLTGCLSVTMLTMHGACYMQIKTENPLKKRAQKIIGISAILTLVLFLTAGSWLWLGNLAGYELISQIPANGPSNPIHKMVMVQPHAWFNNYIHYPWTSLIPLIACLSLISVYFFKKWARTALFSSGLAISQLIATVGISMYPFILPSSTHPNHSLLIWDSSSSQLTLFIMLIATVFFLPLIMLYTSWVYRVLRGKVTEKVVARNSNNMY